MKIKIFAIVFISFISLISFSQSDTYAALEVKIEDPALEKAVRDELKLEDSAILDYKALQNLTSLYPKGQQKIKSLKGLEMAHSLQQLFLPGQEITDISPISSLSNLTFLALDHNQIQNACPIANLYQLKKLVIGNNQIDDIGCLSGLTALTDLLASDNNIQSIAPLTKLKLEWLDISNNPTVDISPLGSMNQLQHVYVDKTSLNDESQSLLRKLGQSGVAVNRVAVASDTVSGISVFVNEDRVLFEHSPFVDSGTTLVQFRPLFEKLGFHIHWDETTRTVDAEKEGLKISLQVDNPNGSLNGVPYSLSVAPRNVDGSIFVPIRFVGEASKYDVTWESSTKTIYLMPVRTVFSPDKKSQVTVSGKWLTKTPPKETDYQIFAVNGNNALFSMTEPKWQVEELKTLAEYEDAVKELLEPDNRKLTPFSEDKILKINGMDARQFSYSVNVANDVNYTVVQTLIEGKYSYFRVILITGDLVNAEVNNDYQNMIQTFKEIKTAYQLSEEKFGTLKPTERLLEAAHYYRNLGFFDADKGLTSQEFDHKFLDFYKTYKDWDPFDSSKYYNEFAELFVLGQDHDRVWLGDTEEANAGRGNDVYVRTLKKWSEISRGAFQPSDMTETWGTEEGPITVSFTLNGQKKTIHPEYMYDYIDTDILKELNEMIKDSGYQFVAVEIDEETFVTMLTAEEKLKMQQDRYIQFVSYE